jgi:hypothetical protein
MAMTKAQKAAKAKAYYQKNRDKIRAYGKAYYKENAEACKARTKAWEKANPEKAEVRREKWREKRNMHSNFTDYSPNPTRSVETDSWSKLTTAYFESEEDDE